MNKILKKYRGLLIAACIGFIFGVISMKLAVNTVKLLILLGVVSLVCVAGLKVLSIKERKNDER